MKFIQKVTSSQFILTDFSNWLKGTARLRKASQNYANVFAELLKIILILDNLVTQKDKASV